MPKLRARHTRGTRGATVLAMDGTDLPMGKPDRARILANRFMPCPECKRGVQLNEDIGLYDCPGCGGRFTFRQIDERMLKDAYERQHADEIRRRAHRERLAAERWLRESDLNEDQAAKIEALKEMGTSVVYYILFRGSLKIGTSINVKSRVSSHPWEKLLAVEPGDYELEAKRHKQFREFKVSGEWFDWNADTERMVSQIREESIDWFNFVFHKCPPLPQPKRHVVWAEPEDYPSL